MTCTAYSPLVEQLHRRLAEASFRRSSVRRFRRTEADRHAADFADKRFHTEQTSRRKAKQRQTQTFGSLKPQRKDIWLALGLPKGNPRND